MGKIIKEYETKYNVGDVVIFNKIGFLQVGVIEGYYVEDNIFWFIQDNLGGWWTEELWIYDDGYKCYYPTSTYNKDFYTLHTEKEFLFNLSQMLNNEELCVSIDVENR